MKKIFKEIWGLALSYQDKRDDKGHAAAVVKYALKLVKLENADENVVVPAAILHDIGWSKLSKRNRFSIFDSKLSNKEAIRVRLWHQKESVKLAKYILSKVRYDRRLMAEILEIISQHDTRKGFLSKNDGIMRDADKMWRFTRRGAIADIRRRKVSAKEYINRMHGRIEEPGFFYSISAKNMAKKELKKRRRKF